VVMSRGGVWREGGGRGNKRVGIPIPLGRWTKEKVCAPTLLVLNARYARNVPPASSASSAWTRRSRAWQSLTSDSRRSPVHFTGRRTRLAAHATSGYSG